jgi:hypothetical protein
MKYLLLIAGVAVSVALGESGFGAIVNQDGSLGLTLNAQEELKTVRLGQKKKSARVEFGYGVDAVFGSKLESLPNHLYGDLDATLRLPGWPGSDYYFRAALTGARIEAAQDFRRADFAARLGASLTNDDLLGLLLANVTLGYAQLARVSGPDSLGPGWGNRLDGEFFVSVPVGEKLSLGFRFRAFNQPSDAFSFNTWKTMFEGVATFKLMGTWMHLKYDRGGLPPLYESSSNWSVGVGFAFD